MYNNYCMYSVDSHARRALAVVTHRIKINLSGAELLYFVGWNRNYFLDSESIEPIWHNNNYSLTIILQKEFSVAQGLHAG